MKLNNNKHSFGKKMFKGSITGGAMGGFLGGLYGNKVAQDLIENPPLDTVEISAYERPHFVERTVGGNGHIGFDGVTYEKVNAIFAERNADGSLKMQEVPAQKLTDYGKGKVSWYKQEVTDPVIHRGIDSEGGINAKTKITYEPTGETWYEPEAYFEPIEVNVLGQIAKYSAIGIAAGAIGGALTALALGGCNKEQ